MFNDHGNPMHRRKKLFFIPVIILLFLALSAAVQYLWNTVLSQAVHVGNLTYWQAAGLLLLSRILFGSFHFGRGGRQFGPPNHMREKWMNMSMEERAKFKEEFKDRCRGRRG